MIQGEPVRGVLHSTDAHAGAEIILYSPGSPTQRVIGPTEILEIVEINLVTVAGGDCYVTVGADATVQDYLTVVRGTFASNGGLAIRFGSDDPWVGAAKAHKPYLTAPAGVVDVSLVGRIRKLGNDGTRPSWKEGR